MNDAEIDKLFMAWWQENFPTPPSGHTRMSHICFGRFLVNLLQHEQQHQEQPR